ncbi:hypothetical protein AXE80_09940 [Wenyingzhuangia fucanilytica]|uniref:DUF481 domain-containing protein n=1 Tax=Wenyingzhuangia fucanilytica TaxID=1790137 RepID=A0A1B1Y753_9FLAO|nr:DUF481 domain-containing protein [Wenyingzhuangia fucanilytica]ANW96579.1 hypothetical protein AXE80_09940 [Wenyingzhuangia fucanilytica]
MRNQLLLLFITFSISTLYANSTIVKKDTITTTDNTVLIGDIKNLDALKLIISTNYSKDDLHLKWNNIASIKSDKNFTFFFSNGERIRGKISDINLDFIEIRNDKTTNKFLRKQLISFKLTDDLFHDRFDAHTEFSLSHKKALNYFQYSTDLGVNYDTKKISLLFDLNINNVHTNSTDNIKRLTLNTGVDNYLKNNFYISSRVKLFKNSQQNLDLRTTTSTAFGVKFINRPKIVSNVTIGLSLNNERFTQNNFHENSIEIYSGLKIKLLDFNKNTLEFNSHHYLSTTSGKRFRADSQLDYKHDLPHSLYMKASYSYNYDSQISEASKKLDYITNLGIGWKFK